MIDADDVKIKEISKKKKKNPLTLSPASEALSNTPVNILLLLLLLLTLMQLLLTMNKMVMIIMTMMM